MPKNAIDYSNCVIYKICCKDPTVTYEYYGHTTNETKRKQAHKGGCNNENNFHYNQLVYKTMRENGGWENWDFIVIENYPCENVNEARLRERYWIELKQSQLNVNIPTRTREEYKRNNRKQIREQGRQYYYKNIEDFVQYREEHKDQIKEYQVKYREEHKDQISQQKKQYREENVEQVRERKKRYYEQNKEKISLKDKQRIICECGCEINRIESSRHRKSQKHIKLMETKNN